MNSSKSCSSPTYKNLNLRHKQSPIELKERLRKDYKNKVQNCRDMLINRFRGNEIKLDIQNTVKEIYKNLYDFTDQDLVDDEEYKILEDIKNELIEEELKWWLKEYDKSHLEIDWSEVQQEENVICPICQKTNFEITNGNIVCANCKIAIKTVRSLLEVKTTILDTIERHSNSCENEPQFSAITETADTHITHIYFICDSCAEMQLIV